MSANYPVKSGQILLAEPFMEDPFFHRAVVLLCDHNEEGSFGFILNKNTEKTINELISDFPDFDAEVYYGGPVETDTLRFVHNVGDLLDESIQVSQGVWWGGDFDQLKFLVSSQLIQPENIRFFLGYAGWSADQLQDELEFGSWVIADMDANYIFKSDANKLWSQVMFDKGNAFEIIADLPDQPTWN